MGINNILSIASVLFFIPYFLLGNFKGNRRQGFLIYVIAIFPLLDLFIIPLKYGGFSVFHGLVFIFIIITIMIGKFELFNFSSKNGFVFFCVIIFTLLLNVTTSFFIQKSIIELTKYLFMFLYMKLLIDECIENKDFIGKVVFYIKVACLLSLIFLLAQMIFGVNIALYDLNPNIYRYDSLTRFPSYFADAQIYGQFLAISSLLFLIDLVSPISPKTIYSNLFFFVASTIGLLLTGSRAAFLGFIFGLVIIYIFSNYKFRIYSLFAAGLLVLVVLFYSQQFVLFNRTASIAETADLRFSYWNDALKIFYEFPWGIGIGNYKSYVSLYSQNQYWDFFGDFVYMDHPENGYLKILVELGIGGFVLFFSFLLRPLALSFYSFLYPERRSSRQVVMVAAILSWMVAFITVYSLNDIRIFVLVASLVSLIVCEQKKN